MASCVGPKLVGHLAKLVLLYLLRGRHREDVHEMDELRDLEPRDLVLAVRGDILLLYGGAVGRDYEGRRLFAVLPGGTAHYRDVLHAGHRAEEVLDLLRADVLAAADDEVFEAARDVVVALLVHAADVAGVQPTVLVDALRRLLGHVVVALHVVVAAAADFAVSVERREIARLRIDDRDLDAG